MAHLVRHGAWIGVPTWNARSHAVGRADVSAPMRRHAAHPGKVKLIRGNDPTSSHGLGRKIDFEVILLILKIHSRQTTHLDIAVD